MGKMDLSVSATRAPPTAVIDVSLNVSAGLAVAEELVVILPPSFGLAPSGCGDMCRPGPILGSTSRVTAVISSPLGGELKNLASVKILVLTPEVTPTSVQWFVEAKRKHGADVVTTGWARGTGFQIEQMMNSAVMYAGVAGAQGTQMSIVFQVGVNGGTSIGIEPPAGYALHCSAEGTLQQVSLPGATPHCAESPFVLTLNNATLMAGLYSFGVAADVPAKTPDFNTFNIIVRDRYGQTLDAAYRVLGKPVLEIGAGSPTLAWSRSDAGVPSMITVGFSLQENLKTGQIKAVLVSFSDSFVHEGKDLQVSNENGLPVLDGDEWVDVKSIERIKVILDDRSGSRAIPAGRYAFSFKVFVPSAASMPRNNFWYISLCSNKLCTKPGDNYTIISFPLAGFNLGQITTAMMSKAASALVPPVAWLLVSAVA